MTKKTIAIFFGGTSPEHDVSILTGLQIIEAMDSSLYDALPVYIDQNGQWFSGEALLDRKNYHFSSQQKDKLTKITLDLGDDFSDGAFFTVKSQSFFSKNKKIYFDIAFLALHGGAGENGQLQGALSAANVSFTGCDHFASAIFMNKSIAKNILKNSGINVLPDILIKKPKNIALIKKKDLLKDLKIDFPACVKPCNLGSSIGVSKVDNQEELYDALLQIFKMDNVAMIEPFVENLVEYNISVTNALSDDIMLSAIEEPKNTEQSFLSFKDKYLANGTLDNKLSVPISEGMASASRILNPKLTKKQKDFIFDAAKKAFSIIKAHGAPRIDFLCNKKTGEIWLNEINPLPGSLGYYLWQAKEEGGINFTNLLTALINEGFNRSQENSRNIDLISSSSNIFKQR